MNNRLVRNLPALICWGIAGTLQAFGETEDALVMIAFGILAALIHIGDNLWNLRDRNTTE